MINKVKPPIALKLVHSSKETKNDLGGQSAESYSRNGAQKEASKDPHNIEGVAKAEPGVEPEAPVESASIEDQVGLTQVVKEWLEEGKTQTGISAKKMSQKYQGESAPAKGMLLNKKIS